MHPVSSNKTGGGGKGKEKIQGKRAMGQWTQGERGANEAGRGRGRGGKEGKKEESTGTRVNSRGKGLSRWDVPARRGAVGTMVREKGGWEEKSAG